jgi:tetratricopeptide (TPR) repeat protein
MNPADFGFLILDFGFVSESRNSIFEIRISQSFAQTLGGDGFRFSSFDFRVSTANPTSKILAPLVLSCLLLPSVARSQQAGSVNLDSNEQLFYVLAAINAAGYDSGLGIETSDNTRQEVRSLLSRRSAPVLGDLGKFYVTHQVADDPGATLGEYVSLALLLGPPPSFSFTVPESDLPPDAKGVKGLVPLLRRFYQEADLPDLWLRLRPRYENALEAYSDQVRGSIASTDAYLRFPSGAYLGRTYDIYLCLMAAPEQVQARIYGSNYYLVVSPSKQPKVAEVRHQYLHFLLDPLAVKYGAEIHQKEPLEAVARQAPSLGTDFKEDFSLLVTECLIRAVELRMDKPAQPDKKVTEFRASGLILVPYFYSVLNDYERQESSMSVFYKQMVLGIDPKAELRSLAGISFAVPPAPSEKLAPALSAKDQLLNQGDNLIYQGKYADAKEKFQDVLEKFDPHSERALYGVAVAASNLRKPDLAEEYFQRTLQSARDLRIVTWSHIYLGRLYDLEGKRDAAVAEYRAASLTASAYPTAVRAAERGLARPFGAK